MTQATNEALKTFIGTKVYSNGNQEVTAQNVVEALEAIIDQNPSQVVKVAKDGAEFQSINVAVNSITDASINKPYAVEIASGVYLETASITIPQYVSLIGINGVVIDATGNGGACLILQGHNKVKSIEIRNSAVRAIDIITAGNNYLETIRFTECTKGLYVNHTDAFVNVNHVEVVSDVGSMTNAIEVLAGTVNMSQTFAIGNCIATTFATCSGANTKMYLDDVHSFSNQIGTVFKVNVGSKAIIRDSLVENCANAFYVDNGATLKITDTFIDGCSNIAINIGPNGTGTKYTLYNVEAVNSGVYDLLEQSATSIGRVSNVVLDTSKSIIGHVMGSFLDVQDTDPAVAVRAELHVGDPTRPFESAFGEGDSNVRGMLVYTENTVNEFVDVSDDAKSKSGSTFTFTGIEADNSIYMATQYTDGVDMIKHHGIKLLVDTAVVIGTGEIVSEYWNGTAWTEFSSNMSDSDTHTHSYAKRYFEETGSMQVRYNPYIVNGDWTKNDPIGFLTDLYWTRFRIKTAVTTAPVIEQIKLHTSRMEINKDGWPEYFGNARPIDVLPWNARSMNQAFTLLANQDLAISDTLDVGMSDNLFNDNGDRIGFSSHLPFNLDTSAPIKFKFKVLPLGTGSGTWTVRWGYITDGDAIYTDAAGAPTTHATQQSVVITDTHTANIVNTFEATLDVSSMVARRSTGEGDLLFATLECTTMAGAANVALIALEASYVKWCDGAHVM